MAPSVALAADRFLGLPPLARLGIYTGCSILGSVGWCACVWLLCRPGIDVWLNPDRYPLAAGLYLAGTYFIWVAGALWTWQRLEGGTTQTLGIAGDPRWLLHLLGGIVAGLASLAVLIGFELATGSVLWGQAAWQHTPLVALFTAGLTALFFGASEELLFRGFVFRTLRKGWGPTASILVSGWIYALVHFLRLDLGWVQIITPFLGLWAAGALLAWSVERTRSLWVATGLHTGWVYLFFVADHQHLLGYPDAAKWLSGGGFPLGGLLALAMLVALWLTLNAILVSPKG
jgi:membrane protease YdiL (CAAX protease family)